MKRYGISALAAALLALAGCGRDDNPADTTDYAPPLYGGWQVTSGGGDVKYILFSSGRRWDILEADSLNFRSAPSGTFDVDADIIDFGGLAFNYALAGDQLGLVNSVDTIGLVRVTNAPAVSAWIGTAVLADSIPAPFTLSTDIGCDTSALWCGGGTVPPGILYRIDLTTRQSTPLTVNLFSAAVEWDGTGLWCSNRFSNRLTRVDKTTGDTTGTSDTLGSDIYGLAWDGVRLWANSQSARRLIAYDPASRTVVQTINGVFGNGMAFAGSFLYLCKDGAIHRCRLTPSFRADASIVIPGAQAVGIAFDGTSFWIAAAINNNGTFTYRIYRTAL